MQLYLHICRIHTYVVEGASTMGSALAMGVNFTLNSTFAPRGEFEN
jgi:hypothetical protein